MGTELIPDKRRPVARDYLTRQPQCSWEALGDISRMFCSATTTAKRRWVGMTQMESTNGNYEAEMTSCIGTE